MATRARRAFWALACGTIVVLCVSVQSHGQERKRTLGGGTQTTKQGLAGRDCLTGCHKEFSDKYMGMKNVHAVVKENKCEECHLRHGLVAKRAMKKDGNELCVTCHPKDKLGLTKAHVHTAVQGRAVHGLPQPSRV